MDQLPFGTITQVNNQFLIKGKFAIICSNMLKIIRQIKYIFGSSIFLIYRLYIMFLDF